MGRPKAAVSPVPVWAWPNDVVTGQQEGDQGGLNGVGVVKQRFYGLHQLRMQV
ncbi:hypothetical protein [Candidatus Amarolinea dominans]|uniref:hypothetical protein n=1 Tax=Candidatus Amarolinea dominans TaxID=3140696 RepID=UPI001D6B56FF|nr:hypothetical protein [Anaerolineae bacterium]